MFSNAVLIDGAGRTLDDIFLQIAKCIKECASNDESYVTFKFMNVPEQIIQNLNLALKKLHYGTFLCYNLYEESDKEKTKYWYLKISWTVANNKNRKGFIN